MGKRRQMGLKGVSEKKFDVYKADFDKLDKDCNGALECAEIEEMLKGQLTEEQAAGVDLKALVETIDLNQDGKISLYEYIAWVHKGQWKLIKNMKKHKEQVARHIEEEYTKAQATVPEEAQKKMAEALTLLGQAGFREKIKGWFE